jgi:predicted nuclease with TOPRIM domain
MTDVAIIVLPFRGQKSSFAVLVLRDDMQEQLTNRLRELKAEFEAGQAKLAEVEGQANNLRSIILRISGAIQVLEEELAKANGAEPSADTHMESKAALAFGTVSSPR